MIAILLDCLAPSCELLSNDCVDYIDHIVSRQPLSFFVFVGEVRREFFVVVNDADEVVDRQPLVMGYSEGPYLIGLNIYTKVLV